MASILRHIRDLKIFRRKSKHQLQPPIFSIPPVESNILAVLPIELIHMVTDYLPTSSIACLALTSKKALHILGRDSWVNLADERDLFMTLLENDCLKHSLCCCGKLHKVIPKDWPNRRNGAIIDSKCRPKVYDKMACPYYIYWQDIQLAMRRHHLGSGYGIPLCAFNFHTVLEPGYYTRITESVTARIIDDELYVRCIQSRTEQPLHREGERITICAHRNLALGSPESRHLLPNSVNTQYIYSIIKVDKQVECLMSHDTEKGCYKCTALSQCGICDTEYRLGKNRRNLLTITAWHKYGRGENSKDMNWRRRCLDYPLYTEACFSEFFTLPLPSQLGKIYRAWTSQD